MPQIETYLRYAPTRDVVLVLGAGASYADGVPLQKEILQMLLGGVHPEIAGSIIGKQLIQFIEDNFFVRPSSGQYPKLEAVFGFLDHFVQQHESLSARYNHAAIVALRENLIKLIHYNVNLNTDRRSPSYHLLWEAILACNRNVSIITLNYDTLLEQAFEPLFPADGYIDYCIHLMNYERREELREFNFWVNPREPVVAESGRRPTPFKIVKLHGSLNWKYCNCCNQTLLTPWDRRIDLNRGRFVGFTHPDRRPYDYFCPLDGTEFQTLIVPPSYLKSLSNPVLIQLFNEASREIRATRRLVFIGYSLSDYDVHIKALFMKHLAADAQIVVVNPKSSEALRHQYLSLAKQAPRFLHLPFEQLVRDDDLMAELLTPAR